MPRDPAPSPLHADGPGPASPLPLGGLLALALVLMVGLVPMVLLPGTGPTRAMPEPRGISYDDAILRATETAERAGGPARFTGGAEGRDADLALMPFRTGVVMLRRCWQPPLEAPALAACLEQEADPYRQLVEGWRALPREQRDHVLATCDATAVRLADTAQCVTAAAQPPPSP